MSCPRHWTPHRPRTHRYLRCQQSMSATRSPHNEEGDTEAAEPVHLHHTRYQPTQPRPTGKPVRTRYLAQDTGQPPSEIPLPSLPLSPTTQEANQPPGPPHTTIPPDTVPTGR